MTWFDFQVALHEIVNEQEEMIRDHVRQASELTGQPTVITIAIRADGTFGLKAHTWTGILLDANGPLIQCQTIIKQLRSMWVYDPTKIPIVALGVTHDNRVLCSTALI